MGKDKDWLDDYYKSMDSFGLDDWNGDGHYDADERFVLDQQERELIDKMNKRTPSTLFDEDDDDFDKDDDDDFELEDEESEGDDAGVYITVEVGSSETEDEEDDWDDEWKEKEYSYDRTDWIPHDFIKRDYEEEKRVGIKDIHFYCHWMPDQDSILIVQGEIIAENLKGRFL